LATVVHLRPVDNRRRSAADPAPDTRQHLGRGHGVTPWSATRSHRRRRSPRPLGSIWPQCSSTTFTWWEKRGRCGLASTLAPRGVDTPSSAASSPAATWSYIAHLRYRDERSGGAETRQPTRFTATSVNRVRSPARRASRRRCRPASTAARGHADVRRGATGRRGSEIPGGAAAPGRSPLRS